MPSRSERISITKQDHKNQAINAVIGLPDGRWCALGIKLGANQIDAAENLLKIKRQFKDDPKGKPTTALCAVSDL